MKYSDIQKFSKPNYIIDVMWGYLKFKLNRWQEDVGLELNPYFQRGHVWTEEQQIRYVEFIFRQGMSGKDIYFNCKGEWEGPIICIDGLQRLTAALKFLDNRLPIFNGNYLKDFTDLKRIPMDITFKFHVNNLSDDKEILSWYLWMNEGGTPHSKEEIERIIKLIKSK
jgi:hypothetical protein